MMTVPIPLPSLADDGLNLRRLLWASLPLLKDARGVDGRRRSKKKIETLSHDSQRHRPFLLRDRGESDAALCAWRECVLPPAQPLVIRSTVAPPLRRRCFSRSTVAPPRLLVSRRWCCQEPLTTTIMSFARLPAWNYHYRLSLTAGNIWWRFPSPYPVWRMMASTSAGSFERVFL